MLDHTRPFTRSQALAEGISAKALRGPRYRRLLRGVFVGAAVPVTPRLLVEAALTAFPETAFASHFSAARVYGVPVPVHPAEHVTVQRPEHRRVRDGLTCHVAAIADVRTVDGVRVSAPVELFAELASVLGLVDLVVVGDHLVRRGLTSVPDLVARASATPGSTGRLARRAAALVRERVDSPMETRLRLLLVLAGAPEPVVNLTVRDADGLPRRRYDLCWPSVRVIVEYDGRHHIEREHHWKADLQRREEIDDEGYRIVVVTARGIYLTPEETIARVWRLLRARRLSGLPARPREEWRPHFPARPSSA